MKKYLLILVCIISVCNISSFGQATDIDPASIKNGVKVRNNKGEYYGIINPSKDINNEYIITGTTIASFSVSNKADGSSNSFKHTQRVVLNLVTANKNDKLELVFYAGADEMPYTVNQVKELISAYYPISMYESIKQKLDESLSSKKKVILKVEMKTDGYREAQLIF